MRNEFFGDVRDFYKYGILRTLQDALEDWDASGERKILIVWMLSANGGKKNNKKSRFVYLEDQYECFYRDYDEDIYVFLRKNLKEEEKVPDVRLIEDSGIFNHKRVVFFREKVPTHGFASGKRKEWQGKIIREIDRTKAVLVFLDPDTGIRLHPRGYKYPFKYASLEEIKCFWKAGCSVLIYQHYPRDKSVLEYKIFESAKSVKRILSPSHVQVAIIRTLRDACFILAIQRGHKNWISRALRMIEKKRKFGITVSEVD